MSKKAKQLESEFGNIVSTLQKQIEEARSNLLKLSDKFDDTQESQTDVITGQQELLEEVMEFRNEMMKWEYWIQSPPSNKSNDKHIKQ